MGTSGTTPSSNTNVRLIASDKSWIEGDAVRQLETTAALDGIDLAVGLPDLHPGKGQPVGAAFVSRQKLFPILIGNDIGCAMSFWQSDIHARKLKLDRWAAKLHDLEAPWDGDGETGSRDDWCERHGLPEGSHNITLGTIGGGNHFAELQKVEEICNAEAFDALGLERDRCALLVHSGSRALGQSIFRRLLADHGANPLQAGSQDAADYLRDHDQALAWSKASRALIAHRFSRQIGADADLVCDVPHNWLSQEDWRGEPAWIHRKGSASARASAVMIPGSRGTFSYLVRPLGTQDGNAWSLAHGAGRRWQRGYAKSRLSHRYRVGDLERTPLGGRIICEDRELIYDEAPQAYKAIEQVIDDLKQAGLVEVIAVYRPLLTYKQRRGQ
jgi:release factor H-coupled RctB family protein